MLPLFPPSLPAPRVAIPAGVEAPRPSTVTYALVPMAETEAFSFDGRTVVGNSGWSAFLWELPPVVEADGAKVDRAEVDGVDGPSREWRIFLRGGLAFAVSSDGSVIGGVSDTDRRMAIGPRRWLGGIPHPDPQKPSHEPWGPISGLSGDGTVAVGWATMRSRGFQRPNGSWGRTADLEAVAARGADGDVPTTTSLWPALSNARAISRDGRTIVGDQSGGLGFRYVVERDAEAIGDLDGGAKNTIPRAVSGDGAVVVGSAAGRDGTQTFRWTEAEGMIPLGDLPGGAFSSEARGISDDGTVIVGRGRGERIGASGAGDRAFVWDADRGMRDLHTLVLEQGRIGSGLPRRFEAWRLRDAIGVRRLGGMRIQVAGTAIDATGSRVAYVATLDLGASPG